MMTAYIDSLSLDTCKFTTIKYYTQDFLGKCVYFHTRYYSKKCAISKIIFQIALNF